MRRLNQSATGRRMAVAAADMTGPGSSLDPAERDASGMSELWIWPVPCFGDRRPVIADGWGSQRTNADGTTRSHLGVDIMYERRQPGDLAATYPPGGPNGTTHHFMPDGVPALAPCRGIVRFTKSSPSGFSIVVRHAAGWATYYAQLENVLVSPNETVAQGQALGVIGYDQSKSSPCRQLHFEIWRGGRRRGAVDPAPYLLTWPVVRG